MKGTSMGAVLAPTIIDMTGDSDDEVIPQQKRRPRPSLPSKSTTHNTGRYDGEIISIDDDEDDGGDDAGIADHRARVAYNVSYESLSPPESPRGRPVVMPTIKKVAIPLQQSTSSYKTPLSNSTRHRSACAPLPSPPPYNMGNISTNSHDTAHSTSTAKKRGYDESTPSWSEPSAKKPRSNPTTDSPVAITPIAPMLQSASSSTGGKKSRGLLNLEISRNSSLPNTPLQRSIGEMKSNAPKSKGLQLPPVAIDPLEDALLGEARSKARSPGYVVRGLELNSTPLPTVLDPSSSSRREESRSEKRSHVSYGRDGEEGNHSSSSTRVYSRQLYVGNVPPTCHGEELVSLINELMVWAGLGVSPSPAQAPLVDIPTKNFTLIGFKTEGDATAALHLDGYRWKCSQKGDPGVICDLVFKRPYTFVPSQPDSTSGWAHIAQFMFESGSAPPSSGWGVTMEILRTFPGENNGRNVKGSAGRGTSGKDALYTADGRILAYVGHSDEDSEDYDRGSFSRSKGPRSSSTIPSLSSSSILTKPSAIALKPATQSYPSARPSESSSSSLKHGTRIPLSNDIFATQYDQLSHVVRHRIRHILMVDLDNWGNFFMKLGSHLPDNVLVAVFYSDLGKYPASVWTNEYVKSLHRRGQLITVRCNKDKKRLKDAADFALVFAIGHLNGHADQLPLDVAITVLSGDKGFKEMKNHIDPKREIHFVDPHNLDNDELTAIINSIGTR